MIKRILLFAFAVMVLAGLTGCGKPELVPAECLPADGSTGVPTSVGQGLNFSTNTLVATYNIPITVDLDTIASILPAPVAVSTGTAEYPGYLKIATLYHDDTDAVYLYYDSTYVLASSTTYTITIQGVWNRTRSIGSGEKSESESFSFTTE